jgi:hypothetical protein
MGLIERLEHCSQNTRDEYLHELTGRSAAALRVAREALERIADLTERWEDSLVSQANEIARAALKAMGESD